MIWDAFDDDFSDMCVNTCLLVMRDLPAERPRALQILIDIIGFRRRKSRYPLYKSRPGAYFALVLEGWPASTIRVHSAETTIYTVQPLPAHL